MAIDFLRDPYMTLFSSTKPILQFRQLNNIEEPAAFEQCLELVTTWFTDEWGHLHDQGKTREQAIADRRQYLTESTDKIYMAFYGKLVVGAFRTGYKEFAEELLNSQMRKGWQDKLQTNEIWFIYVESSYRGLGVGRQIVHKIKQLAKAEMHANTVLLETLKPGLNHLYKTEGAELVCENYLEHHPTDVLKIKL